jgi:hypothetical protein
MEDKFMFIVALYMTEGADDGPLKPEKERV